MGKKRNPEKPSRQRYLAQRRVTLKQNQVAKQKAKRASRSGFTDSSTFAGSSTVADDDDMVDNTMSTVSASAEETPEPDAEVTQPSGSSPGNNASTEAPSTVPPLAMPNITEHDLLAFQLEHFGDDTKPDNFFIGYDDVWGCEEASQYAQEEEQDADLGYYEDGTKRTITEEEIAFFRRSELEKMLIRLEEEEREEAEEAEEQQREAKGPGRVEELDDAAKLAAREEAVAPKDDLCQASLEVAGSQDQEAVKQATPRKEPKQGKNVAEEEEEEDKGFYEQQRQQSTSNEMPETDAENLTQAELEELQLHQGFGHKNKLLQDRRPSGKRDLTLASRGELRRRNEHIPYAERNKRKWEKYIDDEEDPEQGWMTGHRKLRELDEIKNESVELDY